MRKYLQYLLLILVSVSVCAQKSKTEMSTAKWAEDLSYLDKKIQKQFQSFTPNIKEKFAQEVASVTDRLPEMQNHEVACQIMRLLSTLDDGHTELNIGHSTVGFHRVPLSLYIYEGEFRVLAAHKSYAALIGSRVIAIGGYPIAEAFEKLKANMSRDNDMEYLHAGPGYIVLTELLHCLGLSSNQATATLKFQLENGESKEQNFTGLNVGDYNSGPWATLWSENNIETPLYLSNRTDSYWYKYLPESKTMYFHFARVNNQKGRPSIKKFTAELFRAIDEQQPDKLVIDFRLNNGGNYHLSDPLIKGIKSRAWLNQKGKVWVISGRRTFSAASSTCIFLKQQTETQIIGEPGRTHPNKSDNNEYMTLPNSGFLIEYTTRIRKKWPERPELDRIPVDVKVVPTFEHYSKGYDAALAYLLKLH